MVTGTFLHTASVELSTLATARDVSEARNVAIRKKRMSSPMHAMIVPLQSGGRRTKAAKAQELG